MLALWVEADRGTPGVAGGWLIALPMPPHDAERAEPEEKAVARTPMHHPFQFEEA
jgi:hypothetical protein